MNTKTEDKIHTCPECGSACYCRGDIEDHETDEDTYCEHYLSASCSYNDRDDDYGYEIEDAEARAQQDEDQRLDSPQHGQAADINKVIR